MLMSFTASLSRRFRLQDENKFLIPYKVLFYYSSSKAVIPETQTTPV